MHPVEQLLHTVRSHHTADPDLTRVVINAVSWVEANLAVELLAESCPSRALVTATNLREIVKEMPTLPMAMAVDFETLARVWELEREESAWVRTFDGAGEGFSVVLLGEGNYCYDIAVRVDGHALMLMPHDRDGDFLNPDIVDLMVDRPAVLARMVELLEAMGLPFYPMFYMSVEDWRQEYAQVIFAEVIEQFSTDAEPSSASVGYRRRTSHRSDTNTTARCSSTSAHNQIARPSRSAASMTWSTPA